MPRRAMVTIESGGGCNSRIGEEIRRGAVVPIVWPDSCFTALGMSDSSDNNREVFSVRIELTARSAPEPAAGAQGLCVFFARHPQIHGSIERYDGHD